MLINISKWRDKLTGINVLFPWHKKMSFHKSAVWTLLYKFPVLENNQNKPMLLNRTFYILIMKFYDSWIIFQIFLHCFWPRFSIPIFSRYFLQKLVSRFRLVHFNPSHFSTGFNISLLKNHADFLQFRNIGFGDSTKI